MTKPQSYLTNKKVHSQRQHYQGRLLKDYLLRQLIHIGGVSVIVVIVLMFFYFISMTLPLFQTSDVSKSSEFFVGNTTSSLLLAVDEQIEIGMQLNYDTTLTFFRLDNGKILDSHLLRNNKQSISSHSSLVGQNNAIVLGYTDGQVQIIQHQYRLDYHNEQRIITASLHSPYKDEDLNDQSQQQSIELIAAADTEDELVIVTYYNQHFVLTEFAKNLSLLDDEVTLESKQYILPTTVKDPAYLLIDPTLHWVYIANQSGMLVLIDISDRNNILTIDTTTLTNNKALIRHIQFLTGGISLLVADAQGRISQWSPVRDANAQYKLTKIRELDTDGSNINLILPEKLNKGFVSIHNGNHLNLFHTTAERHLLNKSLPAKTVVNAALAPRGNAILLEQASGKKQLWHIHNEHPEIAFKTLWQKVWYENHDKPKYLWQSSSASNDFEPKFSLIPLTFGTLKAAFYAMLIATPLALMAAIYTAYFMSNNMHRVIKPTIELMEALPTVILGFLAGLWLAPLAEQHLAGFLLILLLLPPAIILFAYSWQHVPDSLHNRVSEDWRPFLLIPLIIILSYLYLQLSPYFEQQLLGTELRHWLTTQGIDFNQRNALIVGIAMGFAVIPTIFSITEDAIYGVPRSLINGSLAIGASPWQTMQNIILPTASPAIFSAVMIGFGRAIGETMIVLMATGNTPVMDINIFEGMRTLSANLAVELPESEVGSTHFRILFLSALILFAFTFFINTLAETVRQSLRNRYSKL